MTSFNCDCPKTTGGVFHRPDCPFARQLDSKESYQAARIEELEEALRQIQQIIAEVLKEARRGRK